MDYIGKNIQLFKREAKNFERLFGVPLKPYFDNITGFDIIKFDSEFVKTPDEDSMADTVRAKYGKEAEDLCIRLCGI